ncbi:MAG: insulinase family protein [Cryomorphaceae bacterium]|nr:insulinase family protein [Cryomorphaceae bacterium]
MKFFKYILPAIMLLAACSAPKIDRSKAPAAGPAPAISLGEYSTFKLDNGLSVIVVQNNKLPRVSYRMTLDRAPIFEGSKAGYVSFAGDLMKTGTTNRSKSEIDEAIDFIGGDLNTFSTGISGSSLSKHSDALLEVMSDVLLHPTFPEEELEKARKQALSGLASAKTSADQISANISNAATYGLSHPYGEMQTEKTTNAITRDDVVSYYNAYFRPNIAYLVIVGDVTVEQAKEQANKYFGSWKADQTPRANYATPSNPSGNRVVFVPLKGAVQSVINICHTVELTPGHPDAIAVSVMNNILGGGVFGGRLMQNLREDKAYTYGARSNVSPDRIIGEFSAYASVRNEVTDSSITEFLYEIDLLTRERVADSTLVFIKNFMNGNFARSLENPQTIANFALNTELNGLPKDYYATYLGKLAAVTADDILRVAKKYLKPENLNITVVGNKEEVGEKLSVFAANGKVEYFDMYGQPWSDLMPAPEGVTAQTVINAYFNSIGGMDQMKKLNTLVEVGKMNLGPMALDFTRKFKDNNKMLMVVEMGGQVFMRQALDGERGSSSQMGQTENVEGDELAGLKKEADLMYLNRPDQYGLTPVLKGIGSIDDQPVYVLDLMKGGALKSTEYFSVESGRRLRSSESVDTPQGAMEIVVDYSNFKTTNGYTFPANIKQLVGPQVIEIVIDEMQINKRLTDSDFKVD